MVQCRDCKKWIVDGTWHYLDHDTGKCLVAPVRQRPCFKCKENFKVHEIRLHANKCSVKTKQGKPCSGKCGQPFPKDDWHCIKCCHTVVGDEKHCNKCCKNYDSRAFHCRECHETVGEEGWHCRTCHDTLLDGTRHLQENGKCYSTNDFCYCRYCSELVNKAILNDHNDVCEGWDNEYDDNYDEGDDNYDEGDDNYDEGDDNYDEGDEEENILSVESIPHKPEEKQDKQGLEASGNDKMDGDAENAWSVVASKPKKKKVIIVVKTVPLKPEASCVEKQDNRQPEPEAFCFGEELDTEKEQELEKELQEMKEKEEELMVKLAKIREEKKRKAMIQEKKKVISEKKKAIQEMMEALAKEEEALAKEE